MLLKDFYIRVASSEQTCTTFLREHQLLKDVNNIDPCHKCGTEMCEKRRKNRNGEFVPIFRCPKKGCQTSRSVRQGNAFFHFTDLNSRVTCNLTLSEIMEIVFMFVTEIPLIQAAELTGRSNKTITDWYNLCREVCTAVIKKKTKMLGTHTNPIQIDEARFAGRRKYNRGRMLVGDKPPANTDEGAQVQNNRNHGARVDGPWVFGLKHGNDCRFFYVERRDKDTLLPIIKRECEGGSVIHSDEWPSYRCLTSEGFIHETVNHQENYVDPLTGAHTQGVERAWLDAKISILKKRRGVPIHMLQSHLDQYCWKMWRRSQPDLFIAFLEDMRATYIINDD